MLSIQQRTCSEELFQIPDSCRLGSANREKNLQAGLDVQITRKYCRLLYKVKTLLWILLEVIHQQKVGLSAHRWLSNYSKYLQPMGLCYYLLIRRKFLFRRKVLFTSKNKFECDRISMGKVVSAVQWPMLIIGGAWAVAYFRKNSNFMEGTPTLHYQGSCATFKFQHKHSQLPHRLSLCSITN